MVPLLFLAYEIVSTDSIEWQTIDSEIVIIGQVTAVKKTGINSDPDFDVVDITVRIAIVLKGEMKEGGELTIRRPPNHGPSDPWAKENWPILFFLKRGDPKEANFKDRLVPREHGRGFIELKDPGRNAVTADFKLLKDRGEILKRVHAQLEKLKKDPQKPRPVSAPDAANVFTPVKGFRRVEVPFNSEAFGALWGGSSVYLVVPSE